jgi:CheY-like chemotaxis protein
MIHTTPDFRPSVLLVEPDATFAVLLAAWLRERGWQVSRVERARQALAQLGTLRVSLLVTSLHTPDMDGFEFLAALRRLPDPPTTLVCTASAAARRWRDLIVGRYGVREIIVRPLPLKDLEALLHESLDPRLGGPAITPEQAEI